MDKRYRTNEYEPSEGWQSYNRRKAWRCKAINAAAFFFAYLVAIIILYKVCI